MGDTSYAQQGSRTGRIQSQGLTKALESVLCLAGLQIQVPRLGKQLDTIGTKPEKTLSIISTRCAKLNLLSSGIAYGNGRGKVFLSNQEFDQ